MGDHTGIVDAVRMEFQFDSLSGEYEITLFADPLNPFVGNFRINVNTMQDGVDGNNNTIELSLGLAKVFSSIDLDNADFTSPADNGVTYILNTDYLEMPVHEAPQMSEFRERVGDQDVVTAVFSMQATLIATKDPAYGGAAGGKG